MSLKQELKRIASEGRSVWGGGTGVCGDTEAGEGMARLCTVARIGYLRESVV